jgi:hypothetical protein
VCVVKINGKPVDTAPVTAIVAASSKRNRHPINVVSSPAADASLPTSELARSKAG